MGLILEPEAQAALDLAKRAVPEGGELDTALLLSALYHGTSLKEQLPREWASWLEKPPARHRSVPTSVPVAASLQNVLKRVAADGKPVSPQRFFEALAASDAGREALISRGMDEEGLRTLMTSLSGGGADGATAQAAQGAPTWRDSAERRQAIEALSEFGRMLTVTEPPHRGVVGMEPALATLRETLVKLGRHNAIIHGPPGCGKTALVYELARQIVRGDASLPKQLRDLDIFELSPTFLRSGASFVGQYDERVKSLITVLEAHPKIVLFVDEIHSLFQSGMHFQGPFSQANEAFKAALGRGSIACIGCTTTAEYRHYIEPDGALDRRFEKIKLEQPSPEATRAILQARLPRLAGHYAPLHIPDEMLRRTVELTEEYLPGRYQPDKSIQLIDRACAVCVTATPPREEVTEDALFEALEATIGHGVVRAGELTEAGVLERLRAKIVGQDEALHAIASAFVGGLGTWKAPKGPRGRFVFCGPTGVGKTETAVLLARILGGGSKEALLRIDCNTLQGSGYDSGPALNRLIGVPPGYIGYARGEGGILSKIRDLPECIVLFDEIEKADPGVGEIILQILDEGRVEDADGNPLDFRRAFIVFTTNAGAIYDSAKAVGFEKPSGAARASPTADVESVMAALRASGHGEEFLGRHLRFFVFKALDDAAIRTVIGQQLAGLRQTAEVRGYQLDWDPTLVDYLASQWQPRFGVRHLTTILRHRIAEQLSVGEAQGELRGVSRIYLEPMRMEAGAERLEHSGLAARERRDGTLVIKLA